MARGINKVILIGNVGQDPEVKYMPSGGAVTNISVATSETWKDKNTGQPQERTEWHKVVFFNRLGEIAGEYLKKGSKVYVEGSLHTRKWQDKQTGQDRYSTEIKANTMQMLDSRGGGGGQGGAGFGGGQQGGGDDFAGGGSFPSYEDFDQGAAPAPSRAPQRAPQGNQGGGFGGAPQGGGNAPARGNDDFDDDIPF